MIDKLEHGWIVDGVPSCDEYEHIVHCHCCWKYTTDTVNMKYLGMGKYICKECYDEQKRNLDEGE